MQLFNYELLNIRVMKATKKNSLPIIYDMYLSRLKGGNGALLSLAIHIETSRSPVMILFIFSRLSIMQPGRVSACSCFCHSNQIHVSTSFTNQKKAIRSFAEASKVMNELLLELDDAIQAVVEHAVKQATF